MSPRPARLHSTFVTPERPDPAPSSPPRKHNPLNNRLRLCAPGTGCARALARAVLAGGARGGAMKEAAKAPHVGCRACVRVPSGAGRVWGRQCSVLSHHRSPSARLSCARAKAPGGAGSMQVKHVLTRESDRLRRREDGQQRCADPRAMPSCLHPRQYDRGLCSWIGELAARRSHSLLGQAASFALNFALCFCFVGRLKAEGPCILESCQVEAEGQRREELDPDPPAQPLTPRASHANQDLRQSDSSQTPRPAHQLDPRTAKSALSQAEQGCREQTQTGEARYSRASGR